MKELRYDELTVGRFFESKFVLTDSLVQSYMEALGLPYKEGKPLPTAIFSSNKPSYEALGGRFPQGTVHLKQKMEHYGQPYLGDEYEVEVCITDKYVKKGRNYLMYETTFKKEGQLLCRQLTTQLLSFT